MGLSICPLCMNWVEDLTHLFLTFTFSSKLWDLIAIFFQCPRQPSQFINASLDNWEECPLKSIVLNRACILILRFLTWNVWKKKLQNFKNSYASLDIIWNLILSQLKSTISSSQWTTQYWEWSPEEKSIIICSGLSFYPSLPHNTYILPFLDNPSSQFPPPQGFIKLNFDGAFTGNPRLASYGGFFRKCCGQIIHIFAGKLGFITNNEFVLWGLEHGLCIALINGYHQLLIKVEYFIIISILKKIQCGTSLSKISSSWCI